MGDTTHSNLRQGGLGWTDHTLLSHKRFSKIKKILYLCSMKTIYAPIRNRDGSYRTGLTPKLKEKLEKKYGVILDDNYYKDFNNFYISLSPPTEIQSYWLKVHPDYKK